MKSRVWLAWVVLAAAFLGMTALVRAADLDDVWRYRGEITNRGMRSEGFCGKLSFNGRQVPAKLGRIRTPIGEYEFVTAGTPWSLSGWKRTSDSPDAPVSEQRFDATPEKGTHWYKSGRRRGAPRDWIYLPFLKLWIDPCYLNAYADSELKDIAEPKGVFDSLAIDTAPQQEKISARSAVFVYEQGISSKGSKSAGERGSLWYNGKLIPVRTGRIKTPIGSFASARGTLPWESQGWFLDDEEIKVEETSVTFTNEDRDKGSYTGARKAGTPTEWCYSPEDKTWMAPEKLQ